GPISWTLVTRKDRDDDSTFHSLEGTASQFKAPAFGVLDLSVYYRLSKDLSRSACLYNLTDKKYWLWDDVRGYDSVGEASALA
ncbi:TonB-dependent hemoglobin/transferrin/lactoferrin family receptor, partial [Pseudomonas aeruginosa]